VVHTLRWATRGAENELLRLARALGFATSKAWLKQLSNALNRIPGILRLGLVESDADDAVVCSARHAFDLYVFGAVSGKEIEYQLGGLVPISFVWLLFVLGCWGFGDNRGAIGTVFSVANAKYGVSRWASLLGSAWIERSHIVEAVLNG
jgi:hypothetical protein